MGQIGAIFRALYKLQAALAPSLSLSHSERNEEVESLHAVKREAQPESLRSGLLTDPSC